MSSKRRGDIWYHNGRKMPAHVTCTQVWGSKPGNGRYWKRWLAKIRRRAWRNPGHERGLTNAESSVNYKFW